MIPDIYVAGPSAEIDRCKKWIDMLSQEGFRITYDWTQPVTQFGSEGSELRDHQLRMFARNDLRGIDEAHLVWLLTGAPTSGALIEFGYALAQGKPIVVSPSISKSVLFAMLPIVKEFNSDEEAFEHILKFSA